MSSSPSPLAAAGPEASCVSSLFIEVPPEISESSISGVMAGSAFASDLKSILRTRQRLQAFVRRLDRYVTGLLISPGGTSLLREAIEASIRLYMVSGQPNRMVEDARFMGAAIAVASSGLLGYRVVAVRGAKEDEWRPHEDGPIRRFIQEHSPETLRFDLRRPPDQAEQRAMRHVVTQHVCKFDDFVAMEHGGVDYRYFAV